MHMTPYIRVCNTDLDRDRWQFGDGGRKEKPVVA